MVELMVVVLIIGILLAVSLPTLLGARERALDRRVQMNIRNAFQVEKAYYVDEREYTDDPSEMVAIEPALDYVAGDTPVIAEQVYLHWVPATDEIYISSKSNTGRCFYLKESSASGAAYVTATAAACGAADAQTYGSAW